MGDMNAQIPLLGPAVGPRQEGDGAVDYDEELQLAMALSEQQLEEDEHRRQQEDEELQKALQLSLMEK